MKQSTKDIFKRHGWRIDRALHNFVYFYYHKHYVRFAMLLTRAVAKGLAWFKPVRMIPDFVYNRYHSKILSSGDVTKILSLDRDINLGMDKNKHVIPFKYANKIIFREPQLIAVMDCPCALNQAVDHRCEPLGKCIAVGRDFAPIWLEHCREKYHARQVSQQEALDIIRQARLTGHVTQAFLKVATGGLTGIICNCCPECCAELKTTSLSRRINPDISQYAESGYSVRRDADACTLCGACVDVCPFDAVAINGTEYDYRRELCMGCELCVERCPSGALALYRDPDKLMPLDIDLLREEQVLVKTAK